MAGTNKNLKAGTIVFQAGDSPDGMYLVRKGELVVYFEQGGKEVVLAKIPEGGMVGEMAMFDRMPRSASVKTSVDSEITYISLDDFGKLMKQIPKWFVGLMSALSGRLRTTNDRLKAIESGQSGAIPSTTASGKPFHGVIRMLHVMELLWHREGSKEGKELSIQRKALEDELIGIFGEGPDHVQALLDVLCSEHVVGSKVDNYKASILSLPNRAALRNFVAFIQEVTKKKPELNVVPQPLLDMLSVLVRLETKAAYNQFNVSYEELCAEAAPLKLNTSTWKDHFNDLQGFGEFLKLNKTSSESGLGVRVVKGELSNLIKNLGVLNKLAQRNLRHI